MNKSKHVTFRCTQDDHKAIIDAAKEVEMSLSEFVLLALHMMIHNSGQFKDEQT